MIHVIDDKELNNRMNRAITEIWNIFEKENFTAKDCLWAIKVIEWEIEQDYWNNAKEES